MNQANSIVSPPSSGSVSYSSTRRTAPQVFNVNSHAIMPPFASGSAGTSLASLPAASNFGQPVQINFQTYLSALQQAAQHLQPAPSVPYSSTPIPLETSSPSSTSHISYSSIHSAVSTTAFSLPGESVSFLPFIPMVCAALAAPFDHLRTILAAAGVDGNFSNHSFRCGAATSASTCGLEHRWTREHYW